MIIVHICITAPYIDGWGYQENLLPFYMHKAGHEVHVIAPYGYLPSNVNEQLSRMILNKGRNYVFDGIAIHRIPVCKITDTLIIPFGLSKILKSISPNVIYHHNINSSSLLISASFCRKHNCFLFADNHADELNCSKNRLWRALYYKGIVRFSCKQIKNDVVCYFGVTYSRCDFLHKYFGVPSSKIRFLPIGADVEEANCIDSKIELRKKYGFEINDKIVASGGKMGRGKGTDELISAVSSINTKGGNIKLILFGTFEDDVTKQLSCNFDFITIFGWCDRVRTLELLKLSDVACWPIHHTTLCEDAIAVGTPLALRKTLTTEHLIDGNGCWIINGNIEESLNELFAEDLCADKLSSCVNEMKQKYDYRTIVNDFFSTYNELVGLQ